MGGSGSTASPRAQEMRRVLVRWQRSGLTLREFGRQRGIALSTLTWWRQVFRRAGEQLNAASKRVAASDAVVFTEVPQPATVPATPFVVEIVLRSGHVVRVPGGADNDTLQRVLQALQATC
jgi:septum formation inhibitor MinC